MKILVIPELVSREIGELLPLPEKERHHCTHVLRLEAGARLQVSDGERYFYTGHLTDDASLLITEKTAIPLPRHRLHIHLSPLPKEIAEELLRRLAEWGVHSVHWTIMARSETFWREEKQAVLFQRWQRLMLEAVKATGRPRVPILHAPQSFKAALEEFKTSSTCSHIFGCTIPQVSLELSRWAFPQEGDIHVWIGPKGDFSDSEMADMRQHGFTPITLGKYIYRIESIVLLFTSQLQGKAMNL